MEKAKAVIFLSIFLLTQGPFGVICQRVKASEGEDEGFEEDLEIIKNLDLLDDLDLFNEDPTFLEDYEDIDQSEWIGEGDD